MSEYSVIYIDAFTAIPYTGNPCAILPHADGLDDSQMQAIARETNLNETSFVTPSSKADFRVRYFTPRLELPFAGHPTIATAFMLAEEGLVKLDRPVTRIHLEFNIGVLPVDIEQKDGKPTRVVMTQQPPVFGSTVTPREIAPCLGLREADIRADCPGQVVGTGVPFLIIPVSTLDALGRVKMERDALAALLDKAGVSAVYAFTLGGFHAGSDTHARLFDPRGSTEDPYTGSAAGAMGCFIIRNGLMDGPHIAAEQGDFVNRPGLAAIEISGSRENITSVKVGGAGVRVMDGKFTV
jgi:trans-2,3-dihydro-3-hydroxyanthranilate isomerase